jgi:hypothetical protein
MAELPHSDAPVRPPGQHRVSGPTTQVPRPRQEPGSRYSGGYDAGQGFSGWAWFAGGLMGLVGLFQVMTGIVALAGSGYYAVPTRNLVIDAGYTTWGWVHLILGILLLGTGGGLVFGSMVARVAGVALAVLSAIVNLAFIPAAPFAGALIIGMDVFLIYGITVHGGEPKEAYE